MNLNRKREDAYRLLCLSISRLTDDIDMKEQKHKKEVRKAKAGTSKGEETERKEKVSARREPTKKIACPNRCTNAFQDKTYGAGIRVFNRAGKGPGSKLYRCTVCLREVTL